MRTSRTLRAALVAASLVTGCAVLEPHADRVLAVDALVAEVVNAARAPAQEQKAALARAQQAFAADPAPLNRLRLATLLASLQSPLRDESRAIELLEPMSDASSPGPGRFAALLVGQLAERQRLVKELDRLDRTARERERTDRERDKREESMRQQLEALRSIERGILDREERMRNRR